MSEARLRAIATILTRTRGLSRDEAYMLVLTNMDKFSSHAGLALFKLEEKRAAKRRHNHKRYHLARLTSKCVTCGEKVEQGVRCGECKGKCYERKAEKSGAK